MLTVQKHNNIDVMSSVDLAELCGVRHDHFMTKAQKVLGDTLPNFREREKYNNGRNERTILMLPEREACLMAMSYSYELQAKVYDSWQEMKNNQPKLPQTFAEALQLAADQAKQLELAKPKVEFVDRYVESTGLKTFREVCKMLGANERKFRAMLVAEDVMYILNGSWTVKAYYLDQKYFKSVPGEKNGHSFNTIKFTARGVEWVSRKWSNFMEVK